MGWRPVRMHFHLRIQNVNSLFFLAIGNLVHGVWLTGTGIRITLAPAKGRLVDCPRGTDSKVVEIREEKVVKCWVYSLKFKQL